MKNHGLLSLLIISIMIASSCASTGGGPGLSLEEAIEQSAEQISADLPKGTRVAIAAFESPNLTLSDYLVEELVGALKDRGIEVADRQALEYVAMERKLQLSGEVSDETVKSIGQFMGADMVITGQLQDLGKTYRYRTSAVHMEHATRGSVTRLTVRNDAALRGMIAALAKQKTARKTAGFGDLGESAGSETSPQEAAPMTAGAYFDRGMLFVARGEFEIAIEDFTEAITLNPHFAAAYMWRALLTDDYDRAIADCTQAITLNPNNPEPYLVRAEYYYSRGDYDQAIADYTQAIRLNPNDAYFYDTRGDVYSSKGDYDRAIADYEAALRINPDSAIIKNHLEDARQARGR